MDTQPIATMETSEKQKAGLVSRIRMRTKLLGNIAKKTLLPAGKPTNLILYVTDACRGRCIHCFVPINKGIKLGIDKIEEISRFYSNPMSGVAFTGGDPFLRPELPQIAELFWKNNGVEAIHIPSNGLHPELHTKMVRDILNKVGSEVTVALSLDCLGEQYDIFRGVRGNFEKMQETYDLMAQVAKENPRCKIVVNSVITNKTVDGIKELITFVRKRMPKVWMHDFDLVRDEPLDKTVLLPPMEKLQEIRPILHENYNHYLNRMGAALKKYQYDLNLLVLQKQRQIPKCKAPDTYLVVEQNGAVAFCELRNPVGNINITPLEEIWKSQLAENMRNSVARGECHCTHGCFQPLNILYNPIQSAIPLIQYAVK
ncbi:MAG: radical SAM protein [Nanoarchaeota archaeon]